MFWSSTTTAAAVAAAAAAAAAAATTTTTTTSTMCGISLTVYCHGLPLSMSTDSAKMYLILTHQDRLCLIHRTENLA